jgi:ion channel-forming bestrophin family protein
MITYNPKDWFKLITAFHKSDTFRRLIPAMIGIGAFTALVVTFEIYVLHWSYKNITIIHSILGFVLSMLLVFRTNTAYERWWEGRKIWGDIVNNSRNLMLKLNAWIENKHDVEYLRNLIINYNYVLKNHLSGSALSENFYNLDNNLKDQLLNSNHPPNVIAGKIYEKIYTLHKSGSLSEIQMIILNDEVKSFTSNCGACERIKKTPIPYSYSIFLKKIISLYVFTIPFAFGPDFKYVTIIISIVVLYVFASIEIIAEEIEDPFGDDHNDLPLNEICNTIKKNLLEITHTK